MDRHESKRLSTFIQTERDEYESQHGNLFAFSLAQALRYYDFVVIIFERYERASELAKTGFSSFQRSIQEQSEGVMSDEQMNLLTQQHRDATIVHLEIESFYLFAKIFLDKIAFFLRDYFGEVTGISLISHHGLQKNHEQYRAAKELVFPDGFADRVHFLQDRIVDFRDDEITHKTNPRTVRGTSYGAEVGMIRTRLYPNERDDQVESHSLSELMGALEEYVEQIVAIIEMNRSKSRFQLKK